MRILKVVREKRLIYFREVRLITKFSKETMEIRNLHLQHTGRIYLSNWNPISSQYFIRKVAKLRKTKLKNSLLWDGQKVKLKQTSWQGENISHWKVNVNAKLYYLLFKGFIYATKYYKLWDSVKTVIILKWPCGNPSRKFQQITKYRIIQMAFSDHNIFKV